MDFIEIKIRKFTSVVKRKDITSPTWFALPNNILLHPDFLNISGDEFRVFIWIFGVASGINCPKIKVYKSLCARQLAIDEKVVELTIEKLNGKRWDVTPASRRRTGNFEVAYPTVQYSTVQDSTEQTEQDITKQGTEKKTKALRSLKATASGEDTSKAIKVYCDEWRYRYGANPAITGKDQGILKRLVKDIGLDKAIDHIKAYLQMPDTWYITKRHDLPTLVGNLNAVTCYIATGKVVTRSDLKHIEQSMQTQSLLKKVENGEI